MATIDYKEKYERAMERARQFFEKPYLEDSAGIVRYIFPELAESEDEKMANIIRESLANVTSENKLGEYGLSHKDVSDWLEKRAEKKPADLKTKAENWYICDIETINENAVTAFHRDEIYYCPKDGYLDVGGALFEVGCLDVFRLATEKEIPQPKQGEQKPADKVEPKFKIGNWVVYDHIPYQVVELPKEGYINLGLKGGQSYESKR